MGQNTSTAVMQRRGATDPDDLDDFPTPPWATRALLAFLDGRRLISPPMRVWEPAANRGHMVRPLKEYFWEVYPSDVHDYGRGYDTYDFLGDEPPPIPGRSVDWIITNPPFRSAHSFATAGLALAHVGVAMLVRIAFLEGGSRYTNLFEPMPPQVVLQFSSRVVMHKGKLVNPNIAVPHVDPKTGKEGMKKPGSATAYAWLVWHKCETAAPFPELAWIPPSRAAHERKGDYE
jgi:hypothetical protein